MKTLKKWYRNLTSSIKVTILICIIFYVLTIVFDFYYDLSLNYILGVYPVFSDNFKVYQIFTFLYTHSINPLHIIGNVLILILFGNPISKVIGDKNTYIFIFLTSIFSFITFSSFKTYENNRFKNKMIELGIDVSKIKQDINGSVKLEPFSHCTQKQLDYIYYYPYTNSSLSGLSGTCMGFIVCYFFLVKDRKKILNLLILLFLFQEITFIMYNDLTISGTTFGHLGGLIGGLIFLSLYKIKKGIK